MSVAQDERALLCTLFDEVGPDQPTLCGGWLTRDLAAHLAIRERRPDAAGGILIPALSGYLDRVQGTYARRPWAELVDLVRSGPPLYSPYRIGAIDVLVNTTEFFVHHEDVRRAGDGWAPRPPEPRRDAALWTALRRAGKLMYRRSPVGVVLRRPDGAEVVAKRGPDTVAVVGEPGELLMHAFGRDRAEVSFDGGQRSIGVVNGLRRGL